MSKRTFIFLPDSLELFTTSESTSTDFGLSGNGSESNFGFATGSTSDFGRRVTTSPLVLCKKKKTKPI